MKLAIAIPTYNRNEQLIKTIAALLPQITSDCCVFILDNNSLVSPLDSSVFLRKIVDDGLVTYIKNKNNIGGDANIIKCMEISEAEYTWVLGDDDMPAEDSIEIIFRAIRSKPQSVFFNFSSDMFFRRVNINGNGLNEFIRAIDSFENLLFISASVYKTEYMQKNIRHAYQNCSSSMQNLACLLSSLHDGSEFSLRTEKLVCWESIQNGWDPLIITMRFFLILDNLNTDARHIKLLSKKIICGSASNKIIAVNIIKKIVAGQDKNRLKQLYLNYITRVYQYDYFRKLFSFLYIPIIFSPTFFLKFLLRIKKK
ncbi:hypothetical protein CSQ93_00725 [Janthinobacterium sp. BJB426]|uniref:glycosyltransferase family 2 protein n=1 Tax=Janthinobacterium sp. BJB426 TaxID=2048010 RepID=UPI000C1105C2|nr:glycosyltransferase family A protein [Janthinobacterium sp. BJB426]PHV29698.1 hypothetical protein CSQ93_00725 [Janthinobacterium sp. BJB426]